MAALIAVYGLLFDPADVRASLDALAPLLPVEVRTLLDDQVEEIIGAGTRALGVASLVSIGLALWTARAGVMALIQGLNIVYGETDRRNIVIQYLWALALTVVLVAFAVLVLLAVVAVPVVLGYVDLGPLGGLLARVGPLAVIGAAMVFVIGGIYR